MKDDNRPTENDMSLGKILFPYVSPESIPLSFTYAGKKMRGIPQAFHPIVTRSSVSSEINSITVSGIDKNGLEVRAECLEYRDYPVVEWCAYFTNRGKTDTETVSDIRISSKLFGTNPLLRYSNGDTCNEHGFEWFESDLAEPFALSPVSGRSCEGAFAYMRLIFKEYGVNLAVGWPGQWEVRMNSAKNGVAVSVGQQRCSTVIRPGETMRTPRLTLMGYTGDESRARNLWRRWYFAHVLPREADGTPIKPRVFAHTFEAGGKPEFTGITEENQLHAIDVYCKRGLKPDGWWIDAGWYPCGGDWTATGSWYPEEARFPNGLSPVGKKCEEFGIDLLMWFEPERVTEGSGLDLAHPEWMLYKYGKDGKADRNRLLNYAVPECLEYITNLIDSIIKDAGIKIYRQDFNFQPLPYWEENEEKNRTGAIENLHVQGYLRLWDELLRRNPGLIIDSCASGGTRNDLDTMRRSVPLQYTDVGLGNHPLKQKQYREMLEWIPYYRSHVLNGDSEDGIYTGGKRTVDEYAYMTAIAPAITTMIEFDDDNALFMLGKKMHPIWRRAAEIMLKGDYYPLSECRNDAGDWYAVQFDCPQTGEGFIQVIRNSLAPDDGFSITPYIRDREMYRLENAVDGEMRSVDGYKLARGLTFYMPRRSGEIWFYTSEEKN